VNAQVVIDSINPTMSAIFSAGLLALWYTQRRQAFIGLLAATYGAKTLGFVVHFIAIQQNAVELRFVSNSLWMLTVSLLSIAVAVRFDLPRRYGTLASISIATMGILGWHIFVRDEMVVRIVALNAGVFTMLLMMAVDFARRPMRNVVEQFLLAQIILNMLGFLLRPLTLLSGDSGMGQASTYWLLLSATDIVLSTLLALAIFTVIALDIVDKHRGDSFLDPLSGLLNRRGFEQMAAETMRVAGPTSPPLALVLSDLDHFKSINDRFGHAVGDQVIQVFGRLLKESAPPGALVARLGGEEFAVLLSQADETVSRLFAETARVVFAAHREAALPADLHPTASFGVAVASHAETLPVLVDRADQALYRAKRDGRDRVGVAPQSKPVTAPIRRTPGHAA
jgi:diguanylate cyclase (GGDEF)-like protein